MKITSVFTVTNYKTKERDTWEVEGFGEETVKVLRKDFPRFSKIVLKGFNIGENFVPLKIR